jgi:threonine/homoserine/homoserine lactone efflux protein
MFGTHNYVLFLFSGILLNITPGQDTIYIIGRSIAQGKKAGMVSVFGIAAGVICHSLFAAFGLAALLAVSPISFNGIKYLGSAYLIYLGMRTFLSPDNIFEEKEMNKVPISASKIFVQGFLTNLLNPKVALFFLAFLPQFVNPVANYGALSFLFLGFTFIVTGTLWSLLVALFSSSLTTYLRKDKKIAFVLNKACGILFIALGINILFITQ